MNWTNEGSAAGQKSNSLLWHGVGESSESHQREEILELLWTMRERGPVRVEEFLQMTEKEGAALLEKMEHDEWISQREGQMIFLEEGERRAKEVIRRHRLAERLLSEVFELEEKYMEASACQFEHILSPQVLDSVCTFLGHPPVCPHGKPIPRGPCCMKYKREMEPLVRPLSDLKLGERGRIVFITPRSRTLLERLSSFGLVPGSRIRLAQRKPSFVVELGETTLALDGDIAREVYVKKA